MVVGVNGSGKSTLIKIISGLYFPNEGYVEVNGIPIQKYKENEIRNQFEIW